MKHAPHEDNQSHQPQSPKEESKAGPKYNGRASWVLTIQGAAGPQSEVPTEGHEEDQARDLP
jgi:hypothetical protein